MPDIFLATKLFLPPLPASALRRVQLWRALDLGLAPDVRLILVCAPAGYGKTTLVSEWVHDLQERPGQGPEVVWLSLGPEDDQPFEFTTLLAAGLDQGNRGMGAALSALLKTPQALPAQAVYATLLNELAGSQKSLILVFDDYQLVHAPAIHAGLAFVLDHLPPNVHVVVISRLDPPLPLHRYRARGQMVEVRSAELSLSAAEISQLVQSLAGYSLDREETALLAGRTEGWAAGVQIAAISLRGRADAARFLRTLSGSQRYLLDYLVEEVFNTQPAEFQRFLLISSILDRFCVPLCDWLLASPGEGGTGSSQPAEAILESLEKSNLFIIPLDDERRWFRYHHLFRDLLQLRLKQAVQAGDLLVEDLHRRASLWFEQEGWIADAIQHAIQASDHERAAGLVERHTLALFSQGELSRLVSWVGLLPASSVARRPWLLVYQAWATVFAGRLAETERLLQQAETALSAPAAGGQARPGQVEKIQPELAGIRGVAAVMAGQVEQALTLAALPDEVLQNTHPFTRCGIYWAIGYAWRIRGELPRAISAFEAMLATARQHGYLWSQVSASIDLGASLRLAGRLRQAQAVFRQALDEAARQGAANAGYMGRLESFLAFTLYEQNELEAALSLVEASLAHNRLWQNANHTVHGLVVYAKIASALGRRADALQALEEAGLAAQEGVVSPLQGLLEVTRLRFWLEDGRLADAIGWAAAHAGQSGPERPHDEGQEQIRIGQARVQIALGENVAAFRLLTEMGAEAAGRGLTGQRIEILVLQALAAADQEVAFTALGQALALGLPEDYRRVYLDEGPPLAHLLRSYRQAARLDPQLRILIDRLLASTPAVETSLPPSLLTDRELEILRLMAEGLNNGEIGARLFISPGTVKAHSAAIYRKLDVANRSEAVARAKDAGLI